MINGPASCDGSCNPNTEEWTELYNSCSSPINIGCYILTDGDFEVTIPPGTILAPYDYYVIGSNNSGGTVDLNLASCNCTSGSLVGTFSNANEQAVLLNSSGIIQDAVYWGSGDFPLNVTTGSIAACNPVIVNIPSPGAIFSQLISGGANGCSMARNCDASANWVQRCGSDISINASNGSAVPKFSASDSTICPGTCISFSDLTTGNVTSWNWTFAGATAATIGSSQKNPGNVCYNNPGMFPVTLAATSNCGNISLSLSAFIQVSSPVVPSISIAGSAKICPGNSLLLQSTPSISYQWLLNNLPIAGAIQQSYSANTPGNYSVKTNDGNCFATSPPTAVAAASNPSANITALGPLQICNGGSTNLSAGVGFNSYQWLNSGQPINGANTSTLGVIAQGNYSVIVSNIDGCIDTSADLTIQSFGNYSIKINAIDSILCEGENTTLSVVSVLPNLLWSNGQNSNSIVVNKTGKYSVVASNQAGCFASDSIEIVVQSLPMVNAGSDTIGNCEGGIFLNGSGSGLIFSWTPTTGLSSSSIPNPIVKTDVSISYTLTVTDSFCSASDKVNIQVDCGNIYFPNSFSPNNDGNNDVFKPKGYSVSIYELNIYNLWGELIFTSKSFDEGWDGTFNNSAAPQGVYVFEATAKNGNEKSLFAAEKKYGTLILIR